MSHNLFDYTVISRAEAPLVWGLRDITIPVLWNFPDTGGWENGTRCLLLHCLGASESDHRLHVSIQYKSYLTSFKGSSSHQEFSKPRDEILVKALLKFTHLLKSRWLFSFYKMIRWEIAIIIMIITIIVQCVCVSVCLYLCHSAKVKAR